MGQFQELQFLNRCSVPHEFKDFHIVYHYKYYSRINNETKCVRTTVAIEFKKKTFTRCVIAL
jgi:hypothetical protein